jgi:hypothetical protein
MFPHSRRLRADAVVLLALILILSSVFVIRQPRIARLEAALAHYQSDYNITLESFLNHSVGTLTPEEDVALDEFVEGLRTRYGDSRPLKPLLVVVDPVGLTQATQSFKSRVKIPAPGGTLPIRDHIRLALDPLGLGATVKDGAILITSRKAIDEMAAGGDHE